MPKKMKLCWGCDRELPAVKIIAFDLCSRCRNQLAAGTLDPAHEPSEEVKLRIRDMGHRVPGEEEVGRAEKGALPCAPTKEDFGVAQVTHSLPDADPPFQEKETGPLAAAVGRVQRIWTEYPEAEEKVFIGADCCPSPVQGGIVIDGMTFTPEPKRPVCVRETVPRFTVSANKKGGFMAFNRAALELMPGVVGVSVQTCPNPRMVLLQLHRDLSESEYARQFIGMGKRNAYRISICHLITSGKVLLGRYVLETAPGLGAGWLLARKEGE